MQIRECSVDSLKCLYMFLRHLIIVGFQTAFFVLLIAVIPFLTSEVMQRSGVSETTVMIGVVLSGLIAACLFPWIISWDRTYTRKYRSDLMQFRIILLPWEVGIKKAYYRFMSWINRTILILLENFVLSTAIVWFFILLDRVVNDLSQNELKGLVEYLLLSLNDLFNPDLIAPVLILTIIFVILGLLNRARNTLIIEDVQRAEKNGEKRTSPNYHLMLIEELNRIFRIYNDVDEQRPIKTSMAERCDITSASLRAGSLDTLLNSATLSETEVTLGPVSIPSNFLLSLTNRVLKGPRLLLSVDREDRTVRLSAVLTSPKNLSWQVTRTIPRAQADDAGTARPTQKQPDEKTLCAGMARELACRIFAGMTRGKTQRWEATHAFIEGLEKYRKGLRSPKDQIFYLKEAEEKFVEALGYDEGYKFAWYNLGVVYAEMKRYDAAEKAFSHAARIDQSQWEPYYAKAVNARHQIIQDTEEAFCRESTQKGLPCRMQNVFSIMEAFIQNPIPLLESIFSGARCQSQGQPEPDPSTLHQDRTPDPSVKYQEIIANLNQAERILKKKRLKDVSEVFMVRGDTYLQIYRDSEDQADLDQAISDLQEATLAGWRRYQAHLASSPTTVAELAREETACRLMQESLSSLAYAHAHTRPGDAECLISHAISIDPTCPEVYFTCGQIHLKRERWKEAVGAFRVAAEIAPHGMKYCLALAIAECLAGAQKRDRCPLVIEKKRDGYVQIVEAYKSDTEKKGEAEKELCAGASEEEWTEINEMFKDLKNEGADQEIKNAINTCHAACCNIHKEEVTHLASYNKSVEDGKLYPTWRGYWEKPLTFQEHYNLARLHYQNRRYHLSIQFLETTLPLRPRDPSASEYIGIASVKQVLSSHSPEYDQILKDGKERLENALEIYRHRIYRATDAKRSPKVFLRGIVRTYYWLGRLLSIRQEYTRAIEVLQLASQLAEESCTDYETSVLKMGMTYRLAWAYLRNRNYDLAEQIFREAIRIAENHLYTDLRGDLEDEIKGWEIKYCSYLGLAYSFLLRGIAPDEVLRSLDKAEKIIKGKTSPHYAGCHDTCLGLYKYTRYLSDPGDKRRCLEECITLLTKGLEGRPTAGKYIALARACISLGELKEVKSGPEEKTGVPAQMPHLARAQECLAHARKMDYYGRHTREIKRLSKRVGRYLTI